MIKVLHIMSSIGTAGGVQSLVWNYYKHMDENVTKLDFAVFNRKMDGFEKGFLDKGSKIHFVTPRRKNFLKHIKELSAAIKADDYDIVHIHQDYLGWLTLIVAWACGIKKRIIHTHKANLEQSLIKKIEKFVLTKITCIFATHYFACGIEAAKWTFGEKKYNKNMVYVLNNAIEMSNYNFDEETRKRMRDRFGFGENYIVLGNVARFTYQKNHELLIDVFTALYKKDNNYRLMLVGDGENFEKIKATVAERGLENAVLMLGSRKDVKDLLQAMDMFILTSRFEGLPVTLVEAQGTGLNCICSSTTTKEINIDNRITYITCDRDIDEWVQKIEAKKNAKRVVNHETLKDSGFDIVTEANKLVGKYKEITNE